MTTSIIFLLWFSFSLVCAQLFPHVYMNYLYRGMQCTGNILQTYYLFPQLYPGCETSNNVTLSSVPACNTSGIYYTSCPNQTCICNAQVTPLGTCTPSSDGLSSVLQGCAFNVNPYADSHYGVIEASYFSDSRCGQQVAGVAYINEGACLIEGNHSGYFRCGPNDTVYHTQCLDYACQQGCNTTETTICDNGMYYICFPALPNNVTTSGGATSLFVSPLFVFFVYFLLLANVG